MTSSRCHRLGKTCEQSTTERKRKLRSYAATTPPAPSPPSRLEEKLDDIASLLRSQAVVRHQTPHFTPTTSTPRTSSTMTTNTTLHQNDAEIVFSPILDDVSVHQLSSRIVEEQLHTFLRAFIPMFPFVHIPSAITAADLKSRRPFLWLVIMAVTTKKVADQFAMEQTIWKVISERILAQHLANLDLLLGLICFASWCVLSMWRTPIAKPSADACPGLNTSNRTNHS